MDDHGPIDPERVRAAARLGSGMYPVFSFDGIPPSLAVPSPSPGGRLEWYARRIPVGDVAGTDDGAGWFVPYSHEVLTPSGFAHATVGGRPCPMVVRVWLHDGRVAASLASPGHHEHYFFRLAGWAPGGTSTFSGLDGERMTLTFREC